MDRNKHIDSLIAKLGDGTINEKEYETLVAWYTSFDDSKVILYSHEADSPELLKARMRQKLLNAVHQRKPWHDKLITIKKWIPYVAAVSVLMLTFSWFFLRDKLGNPSETQDDRLPAMVHDISPGGNRATLTLSDGQIINLSEVENEIVVSEGSIAYRGTLHEVARLSTETANDVVLATPKGGTYQITLSDGTRVWLNAASTLKYPTKFVDSERIVEIEGEAYFQVAADKSKPFKVVSKGQVVEVIGTSFNIEAYGEEPETKTTLVEGSLRIGLGTDDEPPITLLPSQQGVLTNSGLTKRTVDILQYTAWKEGIFYFKKTPAIAAMKQIERWYDVEVSYKTVIPKETFSGEIGRDVSLQTVLEFLELSGIKSQLIERKLIIE